MRIVGIVLAVFVALSFAGPAEAQLGKPVWGAAAVLAMPTDGFDNVVDTGFGGQLFARKDVVPLVSATGTAGYTHFGGKNSFGSASIFEFTAGGLVNLGMFNGGLEFGYFTDVDEWSVVPNVGMKILMVDASLRYKMTDTNWFSLRAGLSF